LFDEGGLFALPGRLRCASRQKSRRGEFGAPQRRGDPESAGRQFAGKPREGIVIAAIAIVIFLAIDASAMAHHRRVADPPPAGWTHLVATRARRMARRAIVSIAPSTSPVIPPINRRASGTSSSARQAAMAAAMARAGPAAISRTSAPRPRAMNAVVWL